MSIETKPIRMERLEKVKFQRREFFAVGETTAEMAAAMEWIRLLGHEAETLTDDGFRYRSVYRQTESDWKLRRNTEGFQCSGWKWIEPGEWLMHMAGDGQDSELDDPHSEGPGDEDFWPGGDDWHRVATTEADR